MFEPHGNFEPALTLRKDRRGKLIKGHLITGDGEADEIVIRNLSMHGMGGFVRGKTPKEGARIQIAMDRIGTFSGTVRWQRGHLFGVEFDEAVDISAVSSSLRARHEEAASSNWQMSDYYKVPEAKPRGILRHV